MSGPVLTTERLVLRLPEAGDLDGFATFAADAETMRHLGGVKTRSEVWRSLCEMRGAWEIRGFAMFSVIERATGRWVGRIGPWQPEGWPGTEVGWGVLPEFAGRGYAYEAAVAAMDYAVEVLGWDDICHTIAPDNHRSIALAERLGSVNRGPTQLPPPLEAFPVDNWGQSTEAWRARRG
ncbi:MAG: acetyltransferase [Proteobacteria bacterium SG_bin6]|nr:MAG: acetyltransferase [Proteobacteria bacterium SG_bin6]